jgi:hypothetical protein
MKKYAFALLVSLSFAQAALAAGPGEIEACYQIFRNANQIEQCIQSNASFETINGCRQQELLTSSALDMLDCIDTQASFETINGCAKVGFRTADDLNICIATHAKFTVINSCARNTVSRKARDINECIRLSSRRF